MNRMKSTIQSYTGTPKELKLERERNFVKYGKMSQNWPSQYGVPMHIGDGDDTVAPTNKKMMKNVVDNTKKSQPFNPVNKKGSKTVIAMAHVPAESPLVMQFWRCSRSISSYSASSGLLWWRMSVRTCIAFLSVFRCGNGDSHRHFSCTWRSRRSALCFTQQRQYFYPRSPAALPSY